MKRPVMPRWIARAHALWRAAVRPAAADADLEEELAFHLDQMTATYEARGMSSEAARAAAQRDLGMATPLAEACRDARGTQLWMSIRRDSWAGWRAARRAPGTSLAAVITLGIGIGTATAMFSVVDGVLLRPLPFEAPERLVRADHQVARGAFGILTREATAFEALGIFMPEAEYNVTLGATPERMRGAEVSASLPAVLGLEMARGRTFTAAEGRTIASGVVIISHRLWTDRFGARADVIGMTLRVDGESREVVGVLPAGTLVPLPAADVWLPAVEVASDPASLWAVSGYVLIGRLRAGVSADEATADLRRLAPRVRDGYPWRMPDVFGATISARPLLDTVIRDVRQRVLLLAAAVALLLLVACANVATLVLSRAVTREREFSVRSALGASRRRLVQQLLTEALALWLVGGVVGLSLGWLGLDALRAWLPPDVPRLQELELDWRALAAALGVTLCTGVVFGLLPARRMSRPDIIGVLRAHEGPMSTGGGRRPLVRLLVVGQLAAAVVLVSGTLLLTRSLAALANVQPGIDASDVVTARLTPDRSVCEEPAECQPFFDEIAARAAALPGVSSVAVAGQVPLERGFGFFAIDVEDHPIAPGAPAFTANRDIVSPGYFATLDIPLLRGRLLTPADAAAAHRVVLVNRAFADHFWPGGEAIGKRLRYVWQREWRTIVGIVGDVRSEGLALPPPMAFYEPYGREHASALTLFVETSQPSDSIAREIRTLVTAASPDVPVSRLGPLTTAVDADLGGPAALVRLLSAFGAAVLVLGAVGTYGVLASSVATRRREFGIRLALGASPARLTREVLGEAARLCGLALVAGLPLSWLAASALRDVLFATAPYDVGAQVGVFVVMAALALLAAAVPALRAARTPAVDALRD